MSRRVFFSFHYNRDASRASQVRNMGTVEGNKPATDNDWETVKKGGDAAIKKWIDGQLNNRSCAVVLIGYGTAKRKWIEYEIKKAWGDGKGVLGIHIHNLKDLSGNQSAKGANPFTGLKVGGDSLGSLVSVYDPPYARSTNVYKYIADNVAKWIEEAIEQRNK